MKNSRTTFFIDITPLCRGFRSGIGFALQEVVRAIDAHTPFHEQYNVVAFAPFDIVHRARMLGLEHIELHALPIPFKVMQALYRLRLLPPVDMWLGAGTYLFYDFRRLPLTPRSRSMVCIHDLTYKKYPQFCEHKNRAFLQRFVPPSVRAATTIIAISEHGKKEIMQELGVPAAKISVVYPPIGQLFYRRTQRSIRAVAKKYGLPQTPYFLALGNSEPRKNLATLLAAYQKLGQPDDVPPLVMFGGMSWNAGPVQEAMRALQKKGYKVTVPRDYVTDQDLPAIISGALCTVTPSIYEGFGYAPLQAVLCQTPAVVSDSLPVNEIVGGYTITVPATSVDHLTAALHTIQQQGRTALHVDRNAIYAKAGLGAAASRLLTAIHKTEGTNYA